MSENRSLGASILVVFWFVAVATWFATRQSIWVDETTQLLGISLPLGEQLRWLIGQSNVELGVPPDRMPPLSYWAGSLWSSIFGLSEMSMRVLGVFATVAGAPALYLAGRKIGGHTSGFFTLAALYTAPGLIITAGEIRTYPIFFGLSCWALLAYVTALLAETPQERRRSTLLLSLLILLMGYSHFFGVVAAFCLFGGLVAHRILLGLEWKEVSLVFFVTLVLLAGLAPFVTAAVGISPDNRQFGLSVTDTLWTSFHFAVRLITDPVFLAHRLALILFVAGVALLAIGTVPNLWENRERRALALAMLFPIASAVLGLGVLSQIISGFYATTPTYSIWLLPVFFAFLTLALYGSEGWSGRRIVMTLAGSALVLGNMLASFALLGNPTLYTHGPGEWLAGQLDDSEHTLVVHNVGDAWGHSYFPIFFLMGGNVTQAVRTRENKLLELTKTGTVPIEDPKSFANGFDRVVSIRTVPLSGAERARIAHGDTTCSETLSWKTGAPAKDAYCGVLAATIN